MFGQDQFGFHSRVLYCPLPRDELLSLSCLVAICMLSILYFRGMTAMGRRDMELTPSSTEDFVVFFLLKVWPSRSARSVGFDCFECRFPREPQRKLGLKIVG